MDVMINKELIKTLRKQKNWSQDELATAAGLSYRTIQRIESAGNCSLESKKALASALEVDLDELKYKPPQSATRRRFRRTGGIAFRAAAYLFIPLALATLVLLFRNFQNTAVYEVVIANPNDISTHRHKVKISQSKATVVQLRNGYTLEVELLYGFTPRLKTQLFHTNEAGRQLLHSSNRSATVFHPVKYVIRPGNNVCFQSPIRDVDSGCAKV